MKGNVHKLAAKLRVITHENTLLQLYKNNDGIFNSHNLTYHILLNLHVLKFPSFQHFANFKNSSEIIYLVVFLFNHTHQMKHISCFSRYKPGPNKHLLQLMFRHWREC